MAPTGYVTPKEGRYNVVQANKLAPDQQNLFSQTINGAQKGIGSAVDFYSKLAGGDPSMFDQLEAPAMRQFGQLQGNIASRFSQGGGDAPGAMSSRNSSGFQNTMGAYGAQLAEKLQSQRLSLQSGASDQLMNLYQQLMGTDMYDTIFEKKKPKQKWWQSAVNAGLPIIGGTVGGYFGGPMGAYGGATAGKGLAGALTGGDTSMDFSGMGDMPTKWGV